VILILVPLGLLYWLIIHGWARWWRRWGIFRSVNSPWLGINLDIGNFPGDPYQEIEKIAPYANIVHFKTYFGGGVWYTLDLDYRRIASILRQSNFKGYVSLEMEGNEPASTAVPKSLELMRQTLG
jgi:L-ribulose-5-phosphate 3-epimerase